MARPCELGNGNDAAIHAGGPESRRVFLSLCGWDRTCQRIGAKGVSTGKKYGSMTLRSRMSQPARVGPTVYMISHALQNLPSCHECRYAHVEIILKGQMRMPFFLNFKKNFWVIYIPNMGLELMMSSSRVVCCTDWASQVLWGCFSSIYLWEQERSGFVLGFFCLFWPVTDFSLCDYLY